MQKKIILVVSVLLVIAGAYWGYSRSAQPLCGDDHVIATVMKSALALRNQPDYSIAKLKVENIINYGKTENGSTCQADIYEVLGGGRYFVCPVLYSVSKGDDGGTIVRVNSNRISGGGGLSAK